jgi:hypothetical protein
MNGAFLTQTAVRIRIAALLFLVAVSALNWAMFE